MPSILHQTIVASAILLPFVLTWLVLVDREVLEPYLDEVFHVGQALTYWRGEWSKWDPKITTPPALYVYSWIVSKAATLVKGDIVASASTLRTENALLLLLCIPFVILKLLGRLQGQTTGSNKAWKIHTTVNICLFPVLFFFSGLYYTDLFSLYAVLETYHEHCSVGDGRGSSLRLVILLFWGILALAARQTNIFWVAVFLGALRLSQNFPRQAMRQTMRNAGLQDVLTIAWNDHTIHDIPIAEAQIEDIIYLILSLAVATLRDFQRAVRQLLPYVGLLTLFGIFVLLNGGVVLGDKDNHVASLHLPQMLYIWTYVAFFSWPLLVPYILNAVIPQAYLPEALRHESTISRLPRTLVVIAFLGIMAAAANFNTIVHPFTLADNRHYVFYVFRILLRHPWIKLAAVPVYLFCAWATITAMGSMRRTHGVSPKEAIATTVAAAAPKQTPRSQAESQSPQPVYLSFVLIWLVSTTLSLITAPLVEPRYFLIPWVIWRMHVPALAADTTTAGRKNPKALGRSILPHADYRLYVETIWYLLINAVTGYMFLYKGFQWPQEPGKVQRFMW